MVVRVIARQLGLHVASAIRSWYEKSMDRSNPDRLHKSTLSCGAPYFFFFLCSFMQSVWKDPNLCVSAQLASKELGVRCACMSVRDAVWHWQDVNWVFDENGAPVFGRRPQAFGPYEALRCHGCLGVVAF